MRGRRQGAIKAVAGWLAIALLLMHGVVPLGRALAVQVDVPWALPDLVVCTGLGIKRIPNPERPARSEERSACPVCQLNALGETLAAPSAVAVQMPESGRTSAFPAPNVHLAVASDPWSWSARAPPLA